MLLHILLFRYLEKGEKSRLSFDIFSRFATRRASRWATFLFLFLAKWTPYRTRHSFSICFFFLFLFHVFSSAISSLFGFGYVSWPMCVCVWSKTESVAVLRLFMDLYFFSLSSLLGQSGLLCVSNTPTPPPPSIVTFRTRSRLFVIIFEIDLTFTCHALSCLRTATHAQLITISWLKTLYSRCSN